MADAAVAAAPVMDPATDAHAKAQKAKAVSTPSKAKATAVVQKGAHALDTPWTFWFAKRATKATENYADGLINLCNVSTVESFWVHYAHIKRPTDIPVNSELSLFRNDTKPMWESFPEGGSWTLRLKKSPLLNKIWEELVLACIGEAFDDPHDVVGVVVSVRQKEDVISIWNKDGRNRISLGERVKLLLQLEPNSPMEYKLNNGKISHTKSAQHNAAAAAAAANRQHVESQ